MKNIIYLLAFCALFSCSKSDNLSDQDLIGTWILSGVSGNCFGITITESADAGGCINLPALEINCSVLEFKGEGQLTYIKNGQALNGTYTVDGERVEVCTGGCLPYALSGNQLATQTGTVPDCNPTYTFSKASENLEDILSTNARKLISKVKVNGQLSEEYTYNTEGSIQQVKYYGDDRSLEEIYTYEFSPLKIVVNRQSLRFGNQRRYEYYDEAANRTRRDFYDEKGNLIDYTLYFHTNNECWIDRRERYKDDQLLFLAEYTYTGTQCNQRIDFYEDGKLTTRYEYQKDGKKYWRQALNFSLLRNNNQSNTTSYTYTRDGDVHQFFSYVSAFTYDETDYPIIENRTYLDGRTEVMTYEYLE